jgi:hypothetical protein
MTDAAVASALAYYAAHKAALFPIPAGQKQPKGIVPSFKHDFSRDPEQWARWQATNPGCNFGVVAFASDWIIVDIDTAGPQGRDEAWALWCGLCAEWGIAPATPHVQSARGGWHVYFKVPEGVDAIMLRQPDAVKGRINIRCVGYTVAAGSFYDGTARGEESGAYKLLSDTAPYPAPAALIARCTPAARVDRLTKPGDRDRNDVAALVTWLAEREQFAAYEDWVSLGMALKLEFGDDGLELWQLAHDQTVESDVEITKWESFATDPTGQSVTLSTFLDRAHKLGWRGSVRKSAASMFGTAGAVAALAAAAGATLATPGPANTPPNGVPMLAGQEELARVGEPILTELNSMPDAPRRPLANDYPTLPESVSGHGLYLPLREAIDRIIAMAETPKSFRSHRVVDALAVLSLVHADTADAVIRRIRALGNAVPDRKIKIVALALQERVERAFVSNDNWILSTKGEIEHDNSDNVTVFLDMLALEIRWNGWLERMEIKGGSDPEFRWQDWTYFDDAIFARLRTRACRTKTRFRPAKEFFWEALLTIAQQNTHDPALLHLAAMQGQWDRTPRLSIWLSRVCHVPCDPYHQAVGRNIIGGIVRRVRHPGCKHDTMAILSGLQGYGKSLVAAVLADMGQSSLNAIRAEAGKWFTDTVELGESSKELVLLLAGKTVAEIGEMGMRNSAGAAHVKAMISRQVDAGRTAYARAVTERPRRNIFIGTTNDDEPLQDPTGNRRFLPVRVAGEIDLAWLAENIGQLIGEAATLEAAGASFDLPREVWAIAAEHQEAARSESEIETRFADWFAPTAMTGALTWITAADLVELMQLAGFRQGAGTAVRGAIMKRLGFRVEAPIVGGKRSKIWVRGDTDRPADIPRIGTRYMIGVDSAGRVRVSLTMPQPTDPAPVQPIIPPR